MYRVCLRSIAFPLITNTEYRIYRVCRYASVMYSLASCNALEARMLYHEGFLNRTLPNQKTFQRVDQRLRENDWQFILIKKKSTDAGLRRTVHTSQLVENILNAVHDTPSTSTRRLSTQLNASKTILHKVLKEQLLHPYHLQKVHEMIPEDFSQCSLQTGYWISIETINILFTYEASFTKNGITNLHNAHVWADENPHATVFLHYQHQFQSINIWVGIIGNFLIGPFVLPERLNGQLYLEFLQNDFPDLIEDLPLETRRNMYFMHDGAPAHYSVGVQEHLNNIYSNRWIGRGGHSIWTLDSRSPDITPLDFYLWGHLNQSALGRNFYSELHFIVIIHKLVKVVEPPSAPYFLGETLKYLAFQPANPNGGPSQQAISQLYSQCINTFELRTKQKIDFLKIVMGSPPPLKYGPVVQQMVSSVAPTISQTARLSKGTITAIRHYELLSDQVWSNHLTEEAATFVLPANYRFST
ncbi:hypothetical protein NQ318_016861 [Aromia moschata]|uniref:Transposable element Tc3 transposase n=1 Tax=Aromia moschata TaxID=1265417 RepID=A0AAV8YVG3_9CUCU|nr:hypothetical protein NQ318_016861 [Aromia moschata]